MFIADGSDKEWRDLAFTLPAFEKKALVALLGWARSIVASYGDLMARAEELAPTPLKLVEGTPEYIVEAEKTATATAVAMSYGYDWPTQMKAQVKLWREEGQPRKVWFVWAKTVTPPVGAVQLGLLHRSLYRAGHIPEVIWDAPNTVLHAARILVEKLAKFEVSDVQY